MIHSPGLVEAPASDGPESVGPRSFRRGGDCARAGLGAGDMGSATSRGRVALAGRIGKAECVEARRSRSGVGANRADASPPMRPGVADRVQVAWMGASGAVARRGAVSSTSCDCSESSRVS